jgi:predicted rRNA pseudouridine synthase
MNPGTRNPRMVNSGILIIDKPRGPSSHQVTAWAGEILGVPVGHAGTLDPRVSGVLVVMIGSSVRLAQILLAQDKEYVCSLRTHADVPAERMLSVMGEFAGRIYQRPPRKSAVARNLRIRTVQDIELLDVSGRSFLLKIRCDAGTYIRSLCHHIGLALGCGAHMEELRRTVSGCFHERDAITLQQLKDAAVRALHGDPAGLDSMIRSPMDALEGLPRIVVRDSAVDAICHGAVLARAGIIEADRFGRGATVVLVTGKGELIGLGRSMVSSRDADAMTHGLVAAPAAVFMQAGTYPRGWKKAKRSSRPVGKR